MLTTGDRESASAALARVDALHTGLTQIVLEGGNLDGIVATLEGNTRPALVWDIAVHHADLHEALGKGAPPEAMWHPVLDASAPRLVGEHTEHVAEVPAYELFRALFSRRSRGQMSGWGTPLDPATLDGLCMFGPRDDDQPVPA